MKTTATTEAVSSPPEENEHWNTKWRRTTSCAGKKPAADLKKDLHNLEAGRKSRKEPTPFVGIKPNGKCQFVALEPDPVNFARLSKCVSELPDAVKSKIQCKMVCVGARKGTIRFQDCAGETSQASNEGRIEVQCETLDELLEDCHPTFIKMDIEGAEPDALSGAKKFLERSEVIWAVCVYHKPEHLWQLPEFMADHSQEYRFFLRKYSGEIWETVCYAVPEKRLHQSHS
jgi:FkbM family methyltransferase